MAPQVRQVSVATVKFEMLEVFVVVVVEEEVWVFVAGFVVVEVWQPPSVRLTFLPAQTVAVTADQASVEAVEAVETVEVSEAVWLPYHPGDLLLGSWLRRGCSWLHLEWL